MRYLGGLSLSPAPLSLSSVEDFADDSAFVRCFDVIFELIAGLGIVSHLSFREFFIYRGRRLIPKIIRFPTSKV